LETKADFSIILRLENALPALAGIERVFEQRRNLNISQV
jgi:hypothetical protein